jgi:hypothetical protein
VRIDIKSETQASDEAAGIYPVDDDTDYAEGEWVANAETGVMEWHAADGTVVSAEEWEAGSEVTAEDAPAEDAPAEDAPAEDAPAEDAPAEDAPAEDAPADETEDAT